MLPAPRDTLPSAIYRDTVERALTDMTDDVVLESGGYVDKVTGRFLSGANERGYMQEVVASVNCTT